jgi:hypothetical protein
MARIIVLASRLLLAFVTFVTANICAKQDYLLPAKPSTRGFKRTHIARFANPKLFYFT